MAVSPLMWLGLVVLVVFFGLCTVFALVVTGAQALEDQNQARWPEVVARVETCKMTRSGTGRRYYIKCRLSFNAGSERIVTSAYSTNVPPPDVWQYPANQVGPFEEWVDRHPPETPIVLRYNPSDPAKIVLVSSDMPGHAPRAANNIKVLELFGGGFLVLLAVARVTRPRSSGRDGGSATATAT